MKRLLTFALLTVLGLPPASGTTVPVTGSGSTDLNLGIQGSVAGKFFSLDQIVGESGFFLACTPGTVCDFSFGVGAGISPDVGFEGGSFGSHQIDFITGGLTFSGSAFVQPNSLETIVPITATGQLTGWYCNFNSSSNTSWCSSVITLNNITGSGSLQAFAYLPGYYNFETAAFSGTATIAPEPTAISLLGTGVVALFGRCRKLRPRAVTS